MRDIASNPAVRLPGKCAALPRLPGFVNRIAIDLFPACNRFAKDTFTGNHLQGEIEMRPILAIVVVIVLALIVAVATGFISLSGESGSLPKVAVEGGSLPKVDADVGKIQVGTKQETIEVPKVEVGTTKEAVSVPVVGVQKPAGN
ncbi:MAG: hypothetical protein PGN09_12090 [Sphingomonas fennica]